MSLVLLDDNGAPWHQEIRYKIYQALATQTTLVYQMNLLLRLVFSLHGTSPNSSSVSHSVFQLLTNITEKNSGSIDASIDRKLFLYSFDN